MKSYLESQITWNLNQDSESRTLFYFVTDPSIEMPCFDAPVCSSRVHA